MTHYQATLVSHTHWDRAWYVTFQEYRIRLVRLVDRLLDTLDTEPDFRVFMLDGQMSVLEDYLEARPDRAAILQGYCRSGRVQVGPWYVLADEFLVSPEALIRNLCVGRKMGEAYGGVMNFGYVPDGFGHIAQLPQILRGFGIDNAFFWRGMGAEGDKLGTEFTWCAPDGSAVTTILMPWGYHNVTNLGYGIHWGDISEQIFNMELAQEKIERAINKLTPMANTDALLLMNGIDHAEAEPRIPQIIALANERLSDTTVHQGTLADHLARVRAHGAALQEFEGEFRWGRYSEILQGVYSTRIHLKQANHAGETLLEKQVEPLTALAWLSGADVPAGTPDLVDLAWHWLLLNHPHDDIYGSGIDEVHHEMAYRFSQSKQIGDLLVRDSLRQLAWQIDYTKQPGTPVIAFNPLGWARREIAEAQIDFEFDDPRAGNFHLVNSAGETVPHQVVSDEQLFWMEVLKPSRKRRVTVLFPADAPAFGYTTVYAQPNEGVAVGARHASPAASPTTDLTSTEHGGENRFFSFIIADDGGITVTDKVTGATYSALHHFSDVEDVGDEYTSCPSPPRTRRPSPRRGSRRSSRAARTATARSSSASSARSASQRASTTTARPAAQRWSICRSRPTSPSTLTSRGCTSRRASATPPTTTSSRSTSRPGCASPRRTSMSCSWSPSAPSKADSTGWVEDPSPLMHQRSFTDLSDGSRGMAILNRGLPSVEVGEDGTIALTLLRSIGWLSRDDLWVRRIAAGPLVPTPGAQCLGDYTYEYAILPHAGDWKNVYQTAHNYNAPLLARRADTHAGLVLREMNITRDDPAKVTQREWQRGGSVPDVHSFITVDAPELVLSAVYRSGSSLIVRVYNVTRQPVTSAIRFGFPAARAFRVSLSEEYQETLPLTDSAITINVRGGEVYTLKLLPA